MAFDIYAGTFTRFYTREWENIVQRQARLDGTEYRMIFAGGDEGPPPASDVRQAVAAWQTGMNSGLAENGLPAIEWSEADEQPYFTDRPGWEGYSALQLWAAYAERPGASPPFELPESWADDSTWLAVIEQESDIHFRTILQASVWLPGDFSFTFKLPGLVEDEVMVASTGSFRDQLVELAARPIKWRKQSLFEKLRKRDTLALQEAAEWGRSRFLAVVEQAEAARVPFMLSF